MHVFLINSLIEILSSILNDPSGPLSIADFRSLATVPVTSRGADS